MIKQQTQKKVFAVQLPHARLSSFPQGPSRHVQHVMSLSQQTQVDRARPVSRSPYAGAPLMSRTDAQNPAAEAVHTVYNEAFWFSDAADLNFCRVCGLRLLCRLYRDHRGVVRDAAGYPSNVRFLFSKENRIVLGHTACVNPDKSDRDDYVVAFGQDCLCHHSTCSADKKACRKWATSCSCGVHIDLEHLETREPAPLIVRRHPAADHLLVLWHAACVKSVLQNPPERVGSDVLLALASVLDPVDFATGFADAPLPDALTAVRGVPVGIQMPSGTRTAGHLCNCAKSVHAELASLAIVCLRPTVSHEDVARFISSVSGARVLPVNGVGRRISCILPREYCDRLSDAGEIFYWLNVTREHVTTGLTSSRSTRGLVWEAPQEWREFVSGIATSSTSQ